MSESGKAVFLSYARDDAAAARRIAEALRSAGLEVWFDENELRGGDQWDAKIRKQIDACTLFVPVISVHTQERTKGYFRLEWKLAVDQTHLLAEGVPFLAPVVIDDTREADAVVPPEFMRVQWTRLPGALPTPQFVEQVKRLIHAPSVGASLDDARGRAQGAPLQKKKSFPGWTWGMLTAVVVGIGVAVSVVRKPEPAATPDPKSQTPDPKSLSPSPAPAPSAAAAQPPPDFASAKSIAVLPFANMSPDKDDAFFADGIHEDILTNLANIGDLRVKSRTSVLQYRDSKLSLRQIARELGAAFVLEGSVRRAGNRLRITGQLIDARTDEHVWAKSYDRELKDVFAVQSELATEIANTLHAVLSPQDKARLARAPTSNTAAYELYLKALAERGSYERTRTLLESAVQLDPNFAQAWGLLGRVLNEIDVRRSDPTGGQRLRAQGAIDTMERLAPDEPGTLLQLVRYYSRIDDYARAEIYLARATKILPGNAEVVQLLGDIEKRHHRFPEALAQYRKAYELDSQSPVIRQALAVWLLALRRYDEYAKIAVTADSDRSAAVLSFLSFLARGSTREMEAWIAAHPDDRSATRRRFAWQSGAADYIRLEEEAKQREEEEAGSNNNDTQITIARMAVGDTARAKADAARFVAEHKGQTGRLLALNLAIMGEHKAALECMEAYLANAKQRGIDLDLTNFPFGQASVLAWAGEKDRAIAELARLFTLPAVNVNVHVLRHCPLWKPLQGEPAFEALLDDPKNNAPLF